MKKKWIALFYCAVHASAVKKIRNTPKEFSKVKHMSYDYSPPFTSRNMYEILRENWSEMVKIFSVEIKWKQCAKRCRDSERNGEKEWER